MKKKWIGAALAVMLGISTVGNVSTTPTDATSGFGLTPETMISQALTHLNDSYSMGGKGSGSIDCSGLIYATLCDMGVSTSNFAYQNPVPVNTFDWFNEDGSPCFGATVTYNGTTVEAVSLTDSWLSADYYNYWDASGIQTGDIVIGTGDGHCWFYLGEFYSRDDVIYYLTNTLGYSYDYIEPHVSYGNGAGGTHWRIECNEIEGVVINNNVEDSNLISGYYVYNLTEPPQYEEKEETPSVPDYTWEPSPDMGWESDPVENIEPVDVSTEPIPEMPHMTPSADIQNNALRKTDSNKAIISGDFNGDGRVNIKDTEAMQSYIDSNSKPQIDKATILAGDLNEDNAITKADLLLLEKMIKK